MKQKKINFISFEGIDGSGKSSIVKLLGEELQKYKSNEELLITREPGGTMVAEMIREVIIKNEMLPITETFLYAASRAEHVANVIKPAIEKDKLILCDRFVHSSIVYQGNGREVGVQNAKLINDFAIANVLPDLIFFLDVSVETSNERMLKTRGNKMDRFETLDDNFKQKLIDEYKKMFKGKENVFTINGEQSQEKIVNEIIKILKDKKVI